MTPPRPPYISDAEPSPGPNGDLGQIIRALRVRRRLRIEDVATRTNMERAHLGKLELGRCRWRIDDLQRVAAALRTTVTDLIAQADL